MDNPWKELAPDPEPVPSARRVKLPPLPRIDHVMVGAVALALVLAIANTGLSLWNQSVQSDVSQRQQFINQTTQLSRVYETMIRGLASASITNKDDKLRDLLAVSGITVQANAPADPASAANGSGSGGGPATAAAASPVRPVSATAR